MLIIILLSGFGNSILLGMDVLNASDEDKLSYDSYYGTRDKLNKLVEDALPAQQLL